MMRRLLIFALMLLAPGCVSLEKVTMPANQKAEYDFSSYSVKPLTNPEWRFGGIDNDLQSIRFINSKHYTSVIFAIKPVLENVSEEKTDKDIIAFFQSRILKEYKLSPDISLEDKEVKNFEETIGEKTYKVLKFGYTVHEDKYEVIIYYWLNPTKDIIYNYFIFKDMKNFKDKAWDAELEKSFKEMLGLITIKTPKSKDLISLRVAYAISEFNDSLNDRYIKEKFADLKRKYELARSELLQWAELKKDNYRAYDGLGDLESFNQKFEKYGEGFNRQQALDYFNKAISIRKYYGPAYYHLFMLHKEAKEYDQAIQYIETTIKIYPNDENLYYEAGKMSEEKSDFTSAITYYKKAVRHWAGAQATLNQLKVKLKDLEKKHPQNSESAKQENGMKP